MDRCIKTRTSIRTYDDRPIDELNKEKIINYLENVVGPFNAKVRFSIIDIEDPNISEKLGTYGVIKGAKNFIMASTKKEQRSMEQLGYVLEKGILYATSLGLGTCWLAGTFKRQEFVKAIKLSQDEHLPVISPIGYPKEKRGIVDSFVRFAAGSKNRKDFKEIFFDGSWDNGLDKVEDEKYSLALEMLRLAPSASNKQPWRVLVEDNLFHFYLERNKGYGKALGYDIQKIDIGIAMCHFELSMEELGFNGRWIEQEQESSGSREYIITYKKE